MSASLARDDERRDRECKERESINHQFAAPQRIPPLSAFGAPFCRGPGGNVLAGQVEAVTAVVAAVRPISCIRDQTVEEVSPGAVDSDAAAARALVRGFVF
jgi:hypothetical protein